MIELKKIAKGYLSRKWLTSLIVMGLAYFIPSEFKKSGISDAVTLMSLGIISGVGVAYGVINMKDSKNGQT